MRFDQSRLKINRANVHIGDVERRIALLHERKTAAVEIHPQYHTQRLKHDFSDPTAFDDLALIIGDAIHNLRCALDYTWLQTIEILVPANLTDRAKFPIHKTLDELEGVLKKGNIHSTCPNLFTFMIDEIKPCNGGDDAIWTIHAFDNRDKHRLLIPVFAQGNIAGFEVQDEAGRVWPCNGVGDFGRPPYVIDFERGLHITKKGELTANIIIDDVKTGCFMHIPESLIQYSESISCVVEAFERFLEAEITA